MNTVALSIYAMATRFELVMYGADDVLLRAAGEEALQEIERLASQLSFYAPDSEIHFLNTNAAQRPVRVEPRLFALLQQCAALTEATDGAFDVTVGPLMRAWKFVNGSGQIPSEEALAAARSFAGFEHVLFDEDGGYIKFRKPGVEIDLGGFGKGYAIDRAIEILRENGVRRALLHGGTSSIATIGNPPDNEGWNIALQAPLQQSISLREQCLSVSAPHGKSFTIDGQEFGHVLDPHTGQPVQKANAAAAWGPSASVCEALSKALLVLGADWLPVLHERYQGYRGVISCLDRRAKEENFHHRDTEITQRLAENPL